jgi:hypothetical protein
LLVACFDFEIYLCRLRKTRNGITKSRISVLDFTVENIFFEGEIWLKMSGSE